MMKKLLSGFLTISLSVCLCAMPVSAAPAASGSTQTAASAKTQTASAKGQTASAASAKDQAAPATSQSSQTAAQNTAASKTAASKTTTSKTTTKKAVYNTFYQKLKAGSPVRIAILGDSIAAKAGTDIAHAWDTLLNTWLTETYGSQVTMDSYAIGGTTSFMGYFQSQTAMRAAIQADGVYDLVIICYGPNDDPTNFSLIYESMLRSVKSLNGSCQLITFLESNPYSYSDKMLEIQRLSKRYGADVADTINAYALTGLSYEELSPDGTHPNTEGHQLYFETISAIIEQNVIKNKGPAKFPSPSDKNTSLYENFVYIPLQDCLDADGQYRYTTSLPALGIVYRKSPSCGDILIQFSDGTIWQGSGSTTVQQEWMMASPLGLVIPAGTTVTLCNPDGHIQDTVIGFFASGSIPKKSSKK